MFAYVGEHWFNESDDAPFYLTLAEKLAEVGSLFEPFAARRVQTLGGHSYLQAAFFAVSRPYYAWVVDQGIGAVLIVGLLVGLVRRGRSRGAQWVPLALSFLLFFGLVACRRNTASQLTGVVAVIALFRTVRVPLGEALEVDGERPLWPIDPRRLIAMGALACVPVLMRTSSVAAVVPFVSLVVMGDYVLGNRRPWSLPAVRSLGYAAALGAAGFIVVLMPWSIMMEQSCGTPFFPFGHGNLSPGWSIMGTPPTFGELAHEVVQDMFYGAPLVVMVPFFVAGLAPGIGRARNDVVALTVASFIGFVVLAKQATAVPPEDSVRYYYPFLVAMALVTAATVDRKGPKAALLAACLGMQLGASRDGLARTTSWEVERMRKAPDEDKERAAFEAASDAYHDLQAHMLPDTAAVTAVNENDRFDFRRNRIFALDTLGGMGPKPGWPARQGPEALAKYLEAAGVRYVVWVDFDRGGTFYRRAAWKEHLMRPDFKASYLFGEDTLQIDAADAIEKLPTVRRLVYQGNLMNLVDLAATPLGAGPHSK
jgi:hypothetical protein